MRDEPPRAWPVDQSRIDARPESSPLIERARFR
jgi:hypothetical protein